MGNEDLLTDKCTRLDRNRTGTEVLGCTGNVQRSSLLFRGWLALRVRVVTKEAAEHGETKVA